MWKTTENQNLIFKKKEKNKESIIVNIIILPIQH